MPVKYYRGDLFADKRVINFAHGCNCAGAMGKGIALQFKKTWPQMYLEYKKMCSNGDFVLGDVFVWEDHPHKIFNLGTQKSWRTKATLNAVESSLKAMLKSAEDMGVNHIALPQIGAGLGGLKWIDVKAVINKLSEKSNIKLMVCEEFSPGIPLQEI